MDIAIVGAGPAGAWAAYRLACGGARVALIDPSHPREKPCGGGVTGRALHVVHEQLSGTPPDGIVVRRARFTFDSHEAAVDLPHDGTSPESALTVFGRERFDAALLASTLAAGARYEPVRVHDVERAADGWLISAADRRVHTALIIGADGPNSLVRRRVWRPFDRSQLSIATGYFARGATSDEVAIEFVRDPPGYLWSFPRPDHLAIGVCAQADRATPARLRAIADEWIRRQHIDAPLDMYSWPIPSLSAADLQQDRAAGDRWLLVGDAAGLVDPITREGIFFALQSADFAADTILGGGDTPANYQRMLKEEIATELARAAALKNGFFRPPFVRLLLHGLQTSAPVRRIMSDLVAGRQSYRTLTRTLLATFEVRLAFQLVKLRLAW